jgi:pimeloyl-ACP methyl ester carboxylesterase
MLQKLEAQATRRETSCGAGRLVWRTWGAGSPVVLLHGATGSWTHWVRNIAPLGARFRVVVPDMPGYGESDLPPGPHTADVLADAVIVGLDVVVPPPTPVALVGFSLGGIIAGVVAARQGQRVRTLVLIGPAGLALPYTTPPDLQRVPDGASDEDAREVHRENLRRMMIGDPRRADDLAVHVHVENLRRARFKSGTIPQSDTLLRALPHVRARIAGLWGARDAFVAGSLDARRELLARFERDLDFRVIDGAGHWVIYEAAEAANAALIEMLDGRVERALG